MREVGATQRTMKAANNGGSAVRLMSRKSLSRLQHDGLHTVRRRVTPPHLAVLQFPAAGDLPHRTTQVFL